MSTTTTSPRPLFAKGGAPAAELLAILHEAAGVVISRATPAQHRKWTVSYASRMCGGEFDAKMDRLEALYDANAGELAGIPLAAEDDWTPTQRAMRG